MIDDAPRISKADADAYWALDNRGQVSVSPTQRKVIETGRLQELKTLEAWKARALKAEAKIEELKETWQKRLEDEVRLRMRGRG